MSDSDEPDIGPDVSRLFARPLLPGPGEDDFGPELSRAFRELDQWGELDRWMDRLGGVYGMDGEPITAREWSEMLNDPESRRVARDEIGEVAISTVLLGLDHSYGIGPPLIFETMIFGAELDQEQWRYATKAEALEGHARAVELVRLELAVGES